MKLNVLRPVVALLFFMLCTPAAFAQMEMPAPSPAASVSQVVGFTKITIDYSSPGVKGREVFGELVPFGTPWRAGANAATTISFTTPVKIGDKTLRPGTYSVFVTPVKDGNWQVHFNSKGNSVFSYMKDGKVDEDALMADNAAMVEATAAKSPLTMERLTYIISAEDNKLATVHMLWADMMASFKIDTQAEQLMKRFESAF